MKTQIFKVYVMIIVFGSIVLSMANDALAEELTFDEQGTSPIDPANISSQYALPSEENNIPLQANPNEYIKGQLIVKLKNGYTLTDIQELNARYNVKSAEKVLNKAPAAAEDPLTQFKQKLGELNAKHNSWYWQLEKDSAEYKNYMARIEQEKKELNEKIAIQEEMFADKQQAPLSPDTHVSNLDNVFVQIVPEETDILLMAADYRRNPAVEYAEPNYTQEDTILKD